MPFQQNRLPRRLREEERRLLEALIESTTASSVLLRELDEIWITDMDDGGMGSICAFRPNEDCRYGGTIATASYTDSDSVGVSIVVNLDEKGRFFELDVAKGDFSPLVAYPTPQEINLLPIDDTL